MPAYAHAMEVLICPSRDQRQKRLALFSGPRTPAQPTGTILALIGHFLIIVKLEDHDIRALILGMGREVAISRGIRILFKTTTNRHDLPRTVLLAPLLDQVNCVRKPVMKDALTIVVFHVSRQQGQSLLHVGQEFRLKAGPDFLQRINKPRHSSDARSKALDTRFTVSIGQDEREPLRVRARCGPLFLLDAT